MELDYSFYQDSYHGALSEEQFLRVRVPALAYLARVTGGRCDRAPEEQLAQLLLAGCSLCDAFYTLTRGGGLLSEENDALRVSYAAGRDAREEQRRLYAAVRDHLAGTGLLYRGVAE